jgi:phosphopantetheinyl transferase (holo-ACP synthase)
LQRWRKSILQISSALGNDIVDLADPFVRAKIRDERYLRRILTEEELAALADAAEPVLTLWAIWAAKEAAYKVVRKLDDRALFSPRRFQVDVTVLSGESSLGRKAGSYVRCGDCSVPVRWEFGNGFVHCLAVHGPPDRTDAPFDSVVSRVVRFPSPLSDASRRVRELAIELIASMDRSGPLEIVRSERSPPMVLMNGEPLEDVDISLSHDGHFIAAAVSFSCPHS